jgi:thiamine pyrophosphate-dependent acetolactate synthase large subunit-like protein
VGDGGLSMSLGELATCVRYRLPIKILVLNNGALGQIKWEQMMFLGNPDFGCDLQPVDFAKVAEGHGMLGIRLEDPAECGDAITRALAEPGPALIDAVVDGNEPMLPPKRREDYVDHLKQALGRGASCKVEIERSLMQDPALTSLKS